MVLPKLGIPFTHFLQLSLQQSNFGLTPLHTHPQNLPLNFDLAQFSLKFLHHRLDLLAFFPCFPGHFIVFPFGLSDFSPELIVLALR
jgi:hypothetical protein